MQAELGFSGMIDVPGSGSTRKSLMNEIKSMYAAVGPNLEGWFVFETLRAMNAEPRSRRTGSGRLPGEQTRARAMHRIGLSQGQGSTPVPSMPSVPSGPPGPVKLPSSLEGLERRKRKDLKVEGVLPKGARPAPIGKVPMRKLGASDATSRANGKESPPRSGSSRTSPRTPRGSERGCTDRADKELDVRKRALMLLASSKSAAVKERTESFMQKHQIVLTASVPDQAEKPAVGRQALCDVQAQEPSTAPEQDKPSHPSPSSPSRTHAEPAERDDGSGFAPDNLSLAWLRSAFQWCIHCLLGCVLLSLRCCLGSMNCLKPLLVEEAPRRRYQEKPTARTGWRVSRAFAALAGNLRGQTYLCLFAWRTCPHFWLVFSSETLWSAMAFRMRQLKFSWPGRICLVN